MDMEDHSNHQQYDLRQLVNGVRSSTHFPSMPSPHPTRDDFFPGGHRNLTASVSNQNQHYDMMMLGRGIVLDDFASASTVATATPATTTSPPETLGCIGGDASTGRWPRQETLTLLEIRSRLDPEFKEANQKGPLWDKVSRIMSEEHGYQRSGKKCREKFENLYKYYKKTKEGKAGRHDGKHYRFFRQLEALYGDNSNQTTSSTVRTFHGPSQTNQDNMFYSHSHSHHNNLKHNSDSLSLTNSTDFDTSSSDHSTEAGNIESVEIKRRKRKSGRSWKVKIKDFIDLQVKKLVDKQEEWLDKLVKTMEEKEKERMLRDEEWRKQEAIRIEREHKFWAKERAWIEARDAALMETLHNIAGGREMKAGCGEGLNVITGEFQNNIIQNEDENENEIRGADIWQESEVARLQQLRNEMETWEEVATKMACFGYQRTALMCKKKWESISNCNSNYPRSSSKEGNKKHKENLSRSCFYFNNNDQSPMYNQGSSAYCDVNDQRQEIGKLHRNDGSSPSNSNVAPGDTCFPFLMSEGGNLWENFGLKINKSNQNH